MMPMDSSPQFSQDVDAPEATPFDEGGDGAIGATGAAEPSLDRFASELSAMTEVAAATADTLNRRLHEIGEGEHRAAAASTQLQEQLRLGARMLKAFQSQIARVENTLAGHQAYEQQMADAQSRIEQCFAGIESCIDKTLESVAYRLAEQARTAIARFDEGVASRHAKLAELDGRIAECASGINGICEMVEQVQASATAAVASNQGTLDQLHAAAAQARTMLGRHEQARKSLSSDLNAVRDEMKSIGAVSRDAQESIRQAIGMSGRADAMLRQRLEECKAAGGEADRMAQTVVELNDLLARLQPWEKLLLSGNINADGLPEPIARVTGELKQQISQDMNWLSLTMRDVAERVSSLASVAPGGQTQGGHAPPAAMPLAAPTHEPPDEPEVQVNVKKPLRLRTFNAGA